MPSDIIIQPPEETPEIAYADKWFQRLLTYIPLPAGVLSMIFNQTSLAIFCFVWLTVAIGYAFVKHLRKTSTIKLGIGEGNNHLTLPEVILEPKNEEKQENLIEKPEPNISCTGHPTFIPLIYDVPLFRKVSFAIAKLSGLVVCFKNSAIQGVEVGNTEKVRAEIAYRSKGNDFPLSPQIPVEYGCWLNEPTPYVSFELLQTHYLILGVFEQEEDGKINNACDIVAYIPDEHKAHNIARISSGEFIATVTLIVGNKTQAFEFSFEVFAENQTQGEPPIYLSPEMKVLLKQNRISQLEIRLKSAEHYLDKSRVRNPEFSSNYQKWLSEFDNYVLQKFDIQEALRLVNVKEIIPYPHFKKSAGKAERDEFYSKKCNLEKILKELKDNN